MKIEKIINAPMPSNCYLITDGIGAIVIDPGTIGSEKLLEKIRANGLTIDFILITHEHFDHCAGVNALRKATNAPLWCGNECNELIQDSRGNYSAYWMEGKPFEVKAADHIVEQGEKLLWRNHTIYFYLTPGHSKGCTTIRIDSEALFTGDNYVPNIRTYTNLKGGSKDDLRQTLAFYSLFASYENMTVYPGHLKTQSINQAYFYQSLRGYSEKQMKEIADNIQKDFRV